MSNELTLANKKTTEISSLLAKYKDNIIEVLPKHITPERMVQMVSYIIAKNPEIANCTIQSIIGAMIQTSILGFIPSDSLGLCYYVPYSQKNKDGSYSKVVQFQIGYKGFIDLARRSNEVKTIYAEVVYSSDVFEFELGLNPILRHVPDFESKRTDNDIVYVYAVAHYVNGGFNFVVLTKNEIEKLRLRSPMQKDSNNPSYTWKTDYPAMSKAKAIKQLSKYLPLTIDIKTALTADETVLKLDNFSKDGLKAETIEYDEIPLVLSQKEIIQKLKTTQTKYNLSDAKLTSILEKFELLNYSQVTNDNLELILDEMQKEGEYERLLQS